MQPRDYRNAATDRRVMSYAGLFDTGEGPLKAFRAATGIDHSVLAPGAQEIAFA
jgi:hypothetical protein